MVHVGVLPGAPRAREGRLGAPVDELVSRAVSEARLLAETGFDGVIVENMHDRPYVHGTQGPEVTATMTRVAAAVRAVLPRTIRIGVQVLSGGNREALAIALAAGLDFIRCENFVYAHVADEGLLGRAEAGPLLRYRRMIGAEHVRIYCDIQKKHASHALTADLSLPDLAEAAEFFLADGLIVTGAATGKPASIEDVAAVRRATSLPVLVGSGVTAESARPLLQHADGLIVGSAIKRSGHWTGPLDRARCRSLVRAARRS